MSHDGFVVSHESHEGDSAEGASAPGRRVRISGELDVGSAPRLEAVLDQLIEEGATLVVLDASEVRFVDSSGLRTIIAIGNQLAERGGKLLIEGMSPAMEKILEVTGLLDSYR